MIKTCTKDYSNLLSAGRAYNVVPADNNNVIVMTNKGYPMKISNEYFETQNIDEKYKTENILTPMESIELITGIYELLYGESNYSLERKKEDIITYLEEASKKREE